MYIKQKTKRKKSRKKKHKISKIRSQIRKKCLRNQYTPYLHKNFRIKLIN